MMRKRSNSKETESMLQVVAIVYGNIMKNSEMIEKKEIIDFF